MTTQRFNVIRFHLQRFEKKEISEAQLAEILEGYRPQYLYEALARNYFVTSYHFAIAKIVTSALRASI